MRPLDPTPRLRAADPARTLPADDAGRAELWCRILAAESPNLPAAPTPARPRRPTARVLLASMVALLACIAAALAAGGVIELGAPARLPFSAIGGGSPREGTGALVPGTVRTIPIAAPDPAGGPEWGMRVLSTTRGEGCIQVGRLLDGKLGALGQDGAFGDDGRFHELPVSAFFSINGCALLDGRGRLFTNVTADERPASAWGGVGGRFAGCVPASAGPYEKRVPRSPAERARGLTGEKLVPICHQADLRNLYYGLLGPQARSITYVLGGQRHTLDTVGSDGAYLFVTRASPHQLLNFANAGTADIVPVDGPIKEIHYRNGSTCHLTSKSWIGGAYACTPSLSEPVGYVPLGKAPTHAEVATPLHIRRARNRWGENVLVVSFTARLPVTDASRFYGLHWHAPGMSPGAYGGAGTESDIPAGHTVTLQVPTAAPGGHGSRRARPGVIHGTVFLQQALGAGGLEGPGSVTVPVGSFAVRVP